MRVTDLHYIKLVTETYKSKRANNDLPGLLIHLTCPKIKKECIALYKKRYDKKDEQALRNFFDIEKTGKDLSQLIKGTDADKFKPLYKYLKGETEKTDFKNIELLAWLTDFQHRPWVIDKQIILSDEESAMLGRLPEERPVPELEEDENGDLDNNETIAVSDNAGIEEPPDKEIEDVQVHINSNSEKATKQINLKRAALILLILVIGAGIFGIWEYSQDKGMKMGDALTGCMYWANDHYEKVPCNEERKGRFFVPFNEEDWKNFKRITREDTITGRSIRVVHYLRIRGGREYYTTGGHHPVEVNRKLLPLSLHIFEKYLSKKDSLSNDNLPDSNLKLTSN
jgi:hypothetical protein